MCQLKKKRGYQKYGHLLHFTLSSVHSLCRTKPHLQPHTGHSENDDATNMRGGTEKQNEMVNSHES